MLDMHSVSAKIKVRSFEWEEPSLRKHRRGKPAAKQAKLSGKATLSKVL